MKLLIEVVGTHTLQELLEECWVAPAARVIETFRILPYWPKNSFRWRVCTNQWNCQLQFKMVACDLQYPTKINNQPQPKESRCLSTYYFTIWMTVQKEYKYTSSSAKLAGIPTIYTRFRWITLTVLRCFLPSDAFDFAFCDLSFFSKFSSASLF